MAKSIYPYNAYHIRELQKLKRMVCFLPIQLSLQEIAIKDSVGFYKQQPAKYKDDLHDFSRNFLKYIMDEVGKTKSEYVWAGGGFAFFSAFMFGFAIFAFTIGASRRGTPVIVGGSTIFGVIFAATTIYFAYKYFNAKELQHDLERNKIYVGETVSPRKILHELFEQLEPIFNKHGFYKFLADIKKSIGI